MLNRASLPLLSGNAYSNPASVPKLLSDIFIKSFGILFARIRGAALVMDEKNLCRRVEDCMRKIILPADVSTLAESTFYGLESTFKERLFRRAEKQPASKEIEASGKN